MITQDIINKESVWAELYRTGLGGFLGTYSRWVDNPHLTNRYLKTHYYNLML